MSSLFENGSIIGQTLDYSSTVVTTYEDEVNSAANAEVIETQSISFDSLNSGVDVSSNNSLTLSSTLEEGDIIVVQTFMDIGNATDVSDSDSGSSWVELIGIGRGSTNISNINTQLVYKVVASGNETTDKTVTWELTDTRGGAIVVLVRGGTATGLQSNYYNNNSVNQVDFPALSGAPSNSVALLFSALDDDTNSTIASFPSNYTTAEDFSAGSASGNGIKGYAGYREGVTSTENGEGTKSITYSSSDGIVSVSVLIPRNIATRTAKTNSGVWNLDAVYNILAVPFSLTLSTDSLSSWTISDAADVRIDASNGNPGNCIETDGSGYAYIDTGITNWNNKKISFDVYIKSGTVQLGNFFFACNSSGSGQHARLEARATNSSGFSSTTSWTVWADEATGGNTGADSWRPVEIEINGSGQASLKISGATFQSGYSITNNGGYVGVHGDSSVVSGCRFDNIVITNL